MRWTSFAEYLERTLQLNDIEDFQEWMKIEQEDTVVKPASSTEVYMETQTNINPKRKSLD